MYKVFSKGEKVHVGSPTSWPLWTIEDIDGEFAYLSKGVKNSYDYATQILPLNKIYSVVKVNDDGWYTVAGKPGFVYYIHWDKTTGGAVYRWGLCFATQEIEAFPQPFGQDHIARAFTASDFKNVKLTAEARRQ